MGYMTESYSRHWCFVIPTGSSVEYYESAIIHKILKSRGTVFSTSVPWAKKEEIPRVVWNKVVEFRKRGIAAGREPNKNSKFMAHFRDNKENDKRTQKIFDKWFETGTIDYRGMSKIGYWNIEKWQEVWDNEKHNKN